MQKVVIASGNKGKLREIGEILQDFSMEIIPQSHFNLDEVDETGLTFVENALLKARYAAEETGLPAIADDSGIEVDYLQGVPGIYSARYAKDETPEGEDINHYNNIKLLQALENVPEEQRTARFVCLIVYLRHAKDPTPLISQGIWEGKILTEIRGKHGFGYDPVFYVPEHQCASGELEPMIKNKISHRAQALQRLRQALLHTHF